MEILSPPLAMQPRACQAALLSHACTMPAALAIADLRLAPPCPLQRFGRLGKRCRGGDAKPAAPTEPAADGKPAPAAGQGSRKDPRYMYLSLDEACTHVDATAFRLVAGIYNRQGTRLLTTTVSPPIRVLANNDVPTGAARITLEARLPADWEGWGSDAAGQSAARALATPRGRKGAASASRRKLVVSMQPRAEAWSSSAVSRASHLAFGSRHCPLYVLQLKTPTPGSPANLTVATPMPIPRLPALACSPSNPALPLARTSSMRQLARQQQQQHHHSQHTAHVPQSSAHGCGEAEPLLLPGATMPSSLRRTLTGLAPNQASLLACGSVESTGEAGGSLLRHVGSSTIKQEHAADADYSLEVGYWHCRTPCACAAGPAARAIAPHAGPADQPSAPPPAAAALLGHDRRPPELPGDGVAVHRRAARLPRAARPLAGPRRPRRHLGSGRRVCARRRHGGAGRGRAPAAAAARAQSQAAGGLQPGGQQRLRGCVRILHGPRARTLVRRPRALAARAGAGVAVDGGARWAGLYQAYTFWRAARYLACTACRHRLPTTPTPRRTSCGAACASQTVTRVPCPPPPAAASPSARDWPPAAAAATASDTLLPAASLMEDNLGLPLLGCGSGGFSEVDEEQEQLHTMMMPGHHEPPA